ncbi:MAG: DUF86 domain-containing protein [Bergeyella sp.]
MKHKIGDIQRIQHIIDSISTIEIIVNDVDEHTFINNIEKKFSVERLLEIIGEATNHISDEILYDKENSTSWNQIISLRNFLSHEYFRVDYKIIYKIATNNLIPLKKEILRIKNKLENRNV